MKKIFIICIILVSITNAQSIIINEIMSSNSTVLADEDGDYSDWIELYNPTNTDINLLNFSISDDITNPNKWSFPNVNIASGEYLIVFASDKDRSLGELHTNFKISSAGESIILVDSFGFIIDQVDSTAIPSDISLGRSLSEPSEWLFYQNSTPGGANNTSGYSAFSEVPTFSLAGGFYNSSIVLELSTESGLNDIYFTTDGSDPSLSSSLYTAPINITATTVIRARVFEDGLLPSTIITNTYFIDENITLPVVSLSTNPDNFFDDEIGIYVEGNGDIPNYRQDWERPIHIEFFENDGSLGFSIDCGVQIHGGQTREYNQKSFAVIARGEYGSTSIPYKIFPELNFNEYSSILLRMTGNDNFYAHMRDPLFHTIVNNLDLENQSSRPAIVFLNGEYWGLYFIRERINKDYLAQYHDVDESNLDLLRSSSTILEGDNQDYLDLLNFLQNNNIADDQNYIEVQNRIDINSYINYLLIEMFIVNTDWYGNIKFWRPRNTNGKWRWILFDTDNGFDLYNSGNVNWDMIWWTENSSKEPSIIFKNLMQNQKFQTTFINKFTDLANTNFQHDRILTLIDSISTILEPEMLRQIQKWGKEWQWAQGLLYWNNKVQSLREFNQERLSYMWQHFQNRFGLSSPKIVTISTDETEGGFIKLNSLMLNSFPWSGKYFEGVPITLEAIPQPGYKFIGWSGNANSTERIISYTPGLNNDITAVFELDDQTYPIVINEINYNPPDTDVPERTDWVELYNNSDYPVDLSGWQFKDEGSSFVIPNGTTLNGRDYLVIAEDLNVFLTYYSSVSKVLNENSNIGLSGKGEEIALYSLNGELVDTLRYNDKAPWPTEADGNGPTLELNHPDFNNELGVNWSASVNNYGTPGQANSVLQNKLSVNINVFLEGAYTNSNMMSNSASLISDFPFSQPFNTEPWNYIGNESITEIPNEDITDWVLVELREESMPESIVARRAALLKSNGNIVDLDGKSYLAFYNIEQGDYYLIVHHRNHLSVMSKNKILCQ